MQPLCLIAPSTQDTMACYSFTHTFTRLTHLEYNADESQMAGAARIQEDN